jgi:hypothetical protein
VAGDRTREIATAAPWSAFGRMTDDDLGSIYRYLRTVTPVEHDPGPSLRRKK